MKKISFILLLSLIAVATFAQKKSKKSNQEQKTEVKSSASNDKVLLRYNLKQGESYEQTMENDIKMQIMGMEIPMIQMIQRTSTKNVVTNVDASGNLTTESTIEKFYMKQSNPMMGDLEYDSEDPKKQSPELAQQVSSMKGTKTTTKMSATGKVLDAPKEVGLSNSSNQYPEQAVGVGDTWEISTSIKNPMINKEITSRNQYKLLERANGKVIIEVNGKMTAEGKEVGTMSGKLTIDEKTGIVTEGNLIQNMNIEVQGMETKLDSTIKLTGKKL